MDDHTPIRSRGAHLLLFVLGGLLTLTWLDLKRCHARRRVERTPPTKHETLQTWEGEGGGIPLLRGQGTRGAAEAAPLAD